MRSAWQNQRGSPSRRKRAPGSEGSLWRRILEPDAGITRVDRSGMHAWRVCLKRRRRDYVEYVMDGPEKDRLKSLIRARQVRDEMLGALPPPVRFMTKDRRNTTGVVGVSEEYRRDGQVLINYVASWSDLEGRKVRRRFSVALHGRKKALALAIDARRKALDEIVAQRKSQIDAVLGERRSRSGRHRQTPAFDSK